MQNEQRDGKHFTNEELGKLVKTAKKPGLRYTVDLYLLDYIKTCLLEDGQLSTNIRQLQNALDHLSDPGAKKGVEEVIKSLQCVQSEYLEHLEDMKTLADGGYPPSRGAGQGDLVL